MLADSGSPFRQSVLLNVGARDGIRDGWATMDGIGLVGRISGVGAKTSRVILLTDSNSRIPVVVQPSGQKAILSGDNGDLPPLDFLEDQTEVRPGDQVFSSGDGGVLPAGLPVGQVVMGTDGRLRVSLSAAHSGQDVSQLAQALAQALADYCRFNQCHSWQLVKADAEVSRWWQQQGLGGTLQQEMLAG